MRPLLQYTASQLYVHLPHRIRGTLAENRFIGYLKQNLIPGVHFLALALEIGVWKLLILLGMFLRGMTFWKKRCPAAPVKNEKGPDIVRSLVWNRLQVTLVLLDDAVELLSCAR